jgi:ribosomal protein S1
MDNLNKKTRVFEPDYMGTFISKFAKTFLDYNPGDIIKGKVVNIKDDEVYVDIGGKVEGIIPIQEISLKSVDDASEVVKIGEEINAVIKDVEIDTGKILLSKKEADEKKAWENLQKKFTNKEVVEVIPIKPVRGGLIVEIFGLEGFLPSSYVVAQKEDIKSKLRKRLKCKIIELDTQNKKIVFSEKDAFLEEQRKIQEEVLSNIKEGDVKEGKIIGFATYGAFVDIKGIKGLIHVSEISYKKISNPREVLKEGQIVKGKVTRVDKEAGRIALSLKQLEENPWNKVEKMYPLNSLVEGTVEKCIKAGVLLKIDDDITGLIPFSELSMETQKNLPSPNTKLTVKIILIKKDEEKIFFSLKQAEEEITLQKYKQKVEEQGKAKLKNIFGSILNNLENKKD